MKKILSLLSFVLYLNLSGQTNFIRPSITVFQTTSKNLDSVHLPGNLDRIFCTNNKVSFPIIKTFDSIGVKNLNKAVNNLSRILLITSYERQLKDGSKMNISKLSERISNTITKEQFEMTKSMDDANNINSQLKKQLLNKNYALVVVENDYNSRYSDEKYAGAHKLNATFIVVKLTSFDLINKEFGKNNGEINWEKINDSLFDLKVVSFSNFEKIVGPAAVPKGSSPIADAAIAKTYAKLNKKFETYSEQDYINELYTAVTNAAINRASRSVLDFQVVAPVKNDRPISSSIGSKEGLKIDNRYFVYEQVENEKGDRVEEKVSTVRVRKVGNNLGIASDSSGFSKFYKIGGGNIEPGMYMRNKEDIGIGVAVGYGNDSWIRLDYRIKGITPGLKFFVDANPFPGKVELNRDALKSHVEGLYGGFLTPKNLYVAVSYKFSLGIEKTMHLGSRFSLTPFVGGGKQAVTLSGNFADINLFGIPTTYGLSFDTKEGAIWDGYLVKGGVRAGIHLNSSISLNATASYNSTVLGGYKDPKIIDQDGADFGYFVGGRLFGAETSQKTLEQIMGPILAKQPKAPNGLLWDISLRYEF
jgi:hypothetical protein